MRPIFVQLPFITPFLGRRAFEWRAAMRSIERAADRAPRGVVQRTFTRGADRAFQFQPAARARRFFCFFLKAARLRAVFRLRFFSGMAASYPFCAADSIDAAAPNDFLAARGGVKKQRKCTTRCAGLTTTACRAMSC